MACLLVVLCVLTSCGEAQPIPYSLAPEARTRAVDLRATVRLNPLRTIGDESGQDSTSFGIILDVASGPNGEIYVADAANRRVAIFDSTGLFRRQVGKTGTGPGEFLSVAKVAVFRDGSFVAYDDRQRILSVFADDGAWLNNISVNVGPVEDLAATGDTLVVAAVSGDSLLIHFYKRTGTALGSSRIRPTQMPLAIMPGAFPAGNVCVSRPGAFVYANPMLPEVASIDIARDSIEWLVRTRGVTPKRDRMARPVEGESVILAAACSAQFVTVSYVELVGRRILVDVFRAEDGRQIGRVVLDSTEAAYGWTAAARDRQLLTFRNRPVPQVAVLLIEEIR